MALMNVFIHKQLPGPILEANHFRTCFFKMSVCFNSRLLSPNYHILGFLFLFLFFVCLQKAITKPQEKNHKNAFYQLKETLSIYMCLNWNNLKEFLKISLE